MECLEDRRLLAQTVGLMVNEPQAFDGYTLWGPLRSPNVYLVNNDGDLVHQWQSEYRPNSNYLLEDGTLLRTAQLPNLTWGAGGSSGRVEQLDWDSNVIWSYELASDKYLLHHDIAPILNEDGSIRSVLMIAWEKFTRQEALALGRDPGLPTDNNGELWSETILEVVPDYSDGEGGNIIWQWHLSDHVTSNPAANPQLVDINFNGGISNSSTQADWAHFNGIDYNPQLNQIVVSPRDFSEVWVIDHSTTTQEAAGHTGGDSGAGGDLLYRWGNPRAYGRGTRSDQTLFSQHNPTWIPPGLPGAGNILIYNNGSFRPGGAEFSEVVEINPHTDSQWYLNNRTDGSSTDVIRFNTWSNVPDAWLEITGDWDGDGNDTSGFYDPDQQHWYLNDATDGTTAAVDYAIAQSGIDASWLPVTGDWNNDGVDTVGLYDPATGQWYLSDALGVWDDVRFISGPTTPPLSRLIPISGDWDGQQGDSIGLYDPALNRWVMNNQLDGSSDDVVEFQISRAHPQWHPIIGDWNSNGRDTAGLYDPARNRWYLNNATDGSINQLIVINAPPVPENWRAIAGDWNGDQIDTVGLFNPSYDASQYVILPGGKYGPTSPTWRYVASPRNSFYSSIISGAQRLANGNTLIDEGVTGRLFEVTPSGEMVWEYVNPVTNAGPLYQGERPPGLGNIAGVKANLVFRALKYGPDYAGLDGRTLTPQGPIELYPEFGLVDPSSGDVYLSSDIDSDGSGRADSNDVTELTAVPYHAAWIPIAGDWNGSGRETVGFYDPTQFEFHLSDSNDGDFSGTPLAVNEPSVNGNWIPIAGDWNNDSVDTVGLYDPVSNNWYLNDSVGDWNDVTKLVAPVRVPSNWIPLAGDWNGDGFDSVGFWVPGQNRWILNNKIDGSINDLIIFTAPRVPANWIPIAGDWNGNGRDTLGLYDPTRNRWVLNNKTNGQIDDLIIFTTVQPPLYGLPIMGDWDGSDSVSSLMVDASMDADPMPIATTPAGWNPFIPTDVNGDSRTTPSDALAVINRLARVSDPDFAESALATASAPMFVDVNADGTVSALDALLVINQLRGQDMPAATEGQDDITVPPGQWFSDPFDDEEDFWYV